MKEIKRPLLLLTSLFSFAVLFGFLFSGVVLLVSIIAVAVLFAALMIILSLKRKKVKAVFGVFAVLLGLIVSALYNDVYIKNIENGFVGKEAVYTAHITEIKSQTAFNSSYYALLTDCNGQKTNIKVTLSVNEVENLDIGQDVVFTGSLEKVSGRYEAYEKGQGRFFTISTDKITSYGEQNPTLFDRFKILNGKLSSRLKVITNGNGGLASGIFLGNKSEIDDGVRSDFDYIGVSHILAVSGLHLSIIVGFFDFIVKLITKKKYIVIPLDIAVIIGFALLTGLRFSVLRAGIMMIIYIVAKYLGKEQDPITSLSVACSLIILFMPYAVLDCSFLMSAVAVLGLILVASPVSYLCGKIKLKLVRGIVSSLSATLSVVFFTLPIAYIFYGSVSVCAFLANLIFIPLATVILILAPITLILPACGRALVFVCSITEKAANLLANVSPSPVYIGFDFVPYCFIASLLLFVLLSLIMKSKRKKAIISIVTPIFLALSIIVCSFTVSASNEGKARVFVSTNGSSECILSLADGKTVLTDISTGGWSFISSSCEIGLDKLGKTTVDSVVLTHIHTDKVYSLIEKMASEYRIKTVYYPSGNNDFNLDAFDVSYEIEFIRYDSKIEIGGLDVSFGEAHEVKNRVHKTLDFTYSYGGSSVRFVSKTFGDYLESISTPTFIITHGGGTFPEGLKSQNLFTVDSQTANQASAERKCNGEYLGIQYCLLSLE